MSTPLVQISESNAAPEFILLTPGVHLPREGRSHGRICSFSHLSEVLESASKSQYVAVDFETRGGDYSTDIQIQGIGLSWDTGSAYFDWTELYSNSRNLVREFLSTHTGLIAHNVYFDGGVAKAVLDIHPNWYSCTYALLAMTANEGYPGVGWSLKWAQTALLGWASSNEGELDEWLVLNGYYKGVRRVDNSPEYLRTEYQSGGLRAEKGEMWRAPKGILGKYCILDAESTYLLFTRVLLPVCEQFPALLEFHRREFLHLIRVLIDQRISGIPVERSALESRRDEVTVAIERMTTEFLNHPETSEHIHTIEQQLIEPLLAKAPAKYKKDGGLSLNWVNWTQRVEKARSGENPDYRFNIQSSPQMTELLYNRLGFEPRVFSDKGQPSVGLKALRHMGDIGRLLMDRMWSVKELSFLTKYLELTEHRSTIHPSFRSPGTVTGRLSGKEPNLQQIPKTKAMMGMFHARPGKVWVDLDFSALEPVVTTEFSQDPNMLTIYGDGARPNDIYLYVGAHIPGDIGNKIRSTGYNPQNPTSESLARAKKECKHERGICKTVTLACQYGAGVRKVMQTLEDQDIFLDYEQVHAIHSTYWKVFEGVREFQRELQHQHRANGGYIVNGIGRPMAVPQDFTQDILNRFVQSTGHDILTKYIYILCNNLTEAGIDWTPVIIDFHDATTVEVPEQLGEQTVEIFRTSMAQLNLQLAGSIQLRGVPVIGRNLAEVKEPEE